MVKTPCCAVCTHRCFWSFMKAVKSQGIRISTRTVALEKIMKRVSSTYHLPHSSFVFKKVMFSSVVCWWQGKKSLRKGDSIYFKMYINICLTCIARWDGNSNDGDGTRRTRHKRSGSIESTTHFQMSRLRTICIVMLHCVALHQFVNDVFCFTVFSTNQLDLTAVSVQESNVSRTSCLLKIIPTCTVFNNVRVRAYQK